MELSAIAGGSSAFTIPGFATSSAASDSANTRTSGLGDTFGQAVVLQLQSGLQKDEGLATSLSDALGDSMDYLRSEFGDATAQSAMAMLAKKLGSSGQITEEQFSRGLLETVRLVDGNFGFAAGDEVMRQFNGELNSAINAYFDNGLQERFFAAAPVSAEEGVAAQPAVSLASLADTFATDEPAAASASPMTELLESLQADLESTREASRADSVPGASLEQALAQYGMLASQTGQTVQGLDLLV